MIASSCKSSTARQSHQVERGVFGSVCVYVSVCVFIRLMEGRYVERSEGRPGAKERQRDRDRAPAEPAPPGLGASERSYRLESRAGERGGWTANREPRLRRARVCPPTHLQEGNRQKIPRSRAIHVRLPWQRGGGVRVGGEVLKKSLNCTEAKAPKRRDPWRDGRVHNKESVKNGQ